MSRFRIVVLALLMASSVFAAHARDSASAEDKAQQKNEKFLAMFEGMCPRMLKNQFAKNPDFADLGPGVVQSISGDTCGCFLDELHTRSPADVDALFKEKARTAEIETMVTRCAFRSMKPHVAGMCQEHVRAAGMDAAESGPVCDCVQARIGDADDATVAQLIARDDDRGFESLVSACRTSK
ncbi:MAG: hypothetical protein ACTHOH_00300 [Lysobacteraceae bacterium]